MIEYSKLKEILDYDAVEGNFYWAVSRGFKKRGTKAAHYRLTIDGKVYEAGKLAWFYSYARWPGKHFHYKDNDRANIALKNLANHKRGQKHPKKTVIDYWIRMTRSDTGFLVQMVEKHKQPVDLGSYETYEAAAEVQRLTLVCSE